ncbi:MAG: ABC transporter ATP-binding protein [Nitrososphaeria archaeon]|nr:ABC transporter ATP-binding protein [Nitrososphaeria archaeon]
MIELVRGENLSKSYNIKLSLTKSIKVKAVEDVSLSIIKNEVFGLVGESGSGKSTLGRLMLYMERPDSGKIIFKGLDLSKAKGEEVRTARRKMQVVFQNPDLSLDPRMRIYDTLKEALECCKYKGDFKERMKTVMEDVGLSVDALSMFPHQLSGGMKQRVALARAILAEPEFIVLDEPTSALDVSVQAQILNLLIELRKKLNLTYLFISHNLSVVSYVSDRVGVMYLGKLLEIGECDEVFNEPLHPYTKLLISSVPTLYMAKKFFAQNHSGVAENGDENVSGCRFFKRCPYAKDICKSKEPELKGDKHMVACHFA